MLFYSFDQRGTLARELKGMSIQQKWAVLKTGVEAKHNVRNAVILPSHWSYTEQKQVAETQDTLPSTCLWSCWFKVKALHHVTLFTRLNMNGTAWVNGFISIARRQSTTLHGVRGVWNQMDKWGHMFTMLPLHTDCQNGWALRGSWASDLMPQTCSNPTRGVGSSFVVRFWNFLDCTAVYFWSCV